MKYVGTLFIVCLGPHLTIHDLRALNSYPTMPFLVHKSLLTDLNYYTWQKSRGDRPHTLVFPHISQQFHSRIARALNTSDNDINIYSKQYKGQYPTLTNTSSKADQFWQRLAPPHRDKHILVPLSKQNNEVYTGTWRSISFKKSEFSFLLSAPGIYTTAV